MCVHAILGVTQVNDQGSDSVGFPGSSAGEESACNTGDPSSIPGSGRSPGEGIGYLPIPVFLVFPRGSNSKESTCNAGDLGLIPELGRSPGGRHNNPLQCSCLENPYGQRRLVDSGGLQHMGLQRVRHNWVTRQSTAQHMTVYGLLACCCCSKLPQTHCLKKHKFIILQ